MLRNAFKACSLAGMLMGGGAIMLWAAASAGAEAPDPAADTDDVGGTAQSPPAPESDGQILSRIPPNSVKADGSIDHEALIARQKQRVEIMNSRFGFQLKITETPHYLVVSDANRAMTDQFAKWGESLYANLCTLFGMQDSQRVWDAKCVLFVFDQRTTFDKFAAASGDRDSRRTAAYFVIERYEKTIALVSILIPLGGSGMRQLQGCFAHEGAHAFLELCRKPAALPLWLEEGLPEYVATLNDKSLRQEKVAEATRFCESNRPLSRILEARTGDLFSWNDYCISTTVVDFLVTAGKPKFKKFVDAIKDGQRQEAALSAAYGFKSLELENRWRKYILDYLPKRSKSP
jgi:hypothetical protein